MAWSLFPFMDKRGKKRPEMVGFGSVGDGIDLLAINIFVKFSGDLIHYLMHLETEKTAQTDRYRIILGDDSYQ